MRASRTMFLPPLPFPVFQSVLGALLTQYPEVTVEEIDWALVTADVQAGCFPKAGTLYLREYGQESA